MSAKAIFEQTGKEILFKHINENVEISNKFKFVNVNSTSDWSVITSQNQWLLSEVCRAMLL